MSCNIQDVFERFPKTKIRLVISRSKKKNTKTVPKVFYTARNVTSIVNWRAETTVSKLTGGGYFSFHCWFSKITRTCIKNFRLRRYNDLSPFQLREFSLRTLYTYAVQKLGSFILVSLSARDKLICKSLSPKIC